MFNRIARVVSDAVGTPWAFLIAVATVVVWALSGLFFGMSDAWMLIINTVTTIVTYLMVFVLQCAQTRDTKAVQAKLDELIRAIPDAENALRGIERAEEVHDESAA